MSIDWDFYSFQLLTFRQWCFLSTFEHFRQDFIAHENSVLCQPSLYFPLILSPKSCNMAPWPKFKHKTLRFFFHVFPNSLSLPFFSRSQHSSCLILALLHQAVTQALVSHLKPPSNSLDDNEVDELDLDQYSPATSSAPLSTSAGSLRNELVVARRKAAQLKLHPYQCNAVEEFIKVVYYPFQPLSITHSDLHSWYRLPGVDWLQANDALCSIMRSWKPDCRN